MDKNKIWAHVMQEDPGYFRNGVTTASLNDELKNTEDIDVYLEKNEKNMIPYNLPMYLEMLLSQKGISKAEVARGSNLDRKYTYQIFSGEKTPSRDKLITIAFGLHLSADETQTMLKLSGNRELYVRDDRDAIILFALQREMNIFKTNDLLFDHGFEALGSVKE